MTALDTATHWLRDHRQQLVALLTELVEISSYSRDKAGVEAVGALLRGELEAIGLVCEVHPQSEFGDHLVLRTPAAGGHRALLLGHRDTVFPPDHPFRGLRLDGDLARGPGVADMKGGLAVALFALRALHAAGELAGRPITVALTSDEELGSPTSQPLIEALCAEAGCALVLEPGRDGDRLITRRKGVGTVTIEARGRSAHSGLAHHQGRSAVRALCRVVEAVESLTDYDAGTTLNVGLIRGGQSKNTVPDHAEASVDLRVLSLDAARELEARLHALAEQPWLDGVTLSVSGGLARPPLARSDESLALCEAYSACQRPAGLGGGEMPLVGGGSDANFTGALGVPTLDGLGPRGRGMHTADEQIDLDTLGPKAEALTRFLLTDWRR